MNDTLTMCLTAAAVVISSRAAMACINPPVPTSTVLAAAEIGITPTSLTVIGIASAGSGTVQAILDRIDEAVELRLSLATAHAELAIASASRAEVASRLMVEPDHSGLLAQFQETSLEVATRQQQIEALHASLRESALDGFSAVHIAQIASWTGTAQYKVPPEFRILEFSPAEWIAIAGAVRAEARAIRTGEPLAPEQAAILDPIRSHTAVIEASLTLSVMLEDVKSVFMQFSES